jgi:hypothetical protein
MWQQVVQRHATALGIAMTAAPPRTLFRAGHAEHASKKTHHRAQVQPGRCAKIFLTAHRAPTTATHVPMTSAFPAHASIQASAQEMIPAADAQRAQAAIRMVGSTQAYGMFIAARNASPRNTEITIATPRIHVHIQWEITGISAKTLTKANHAPLLKVIQGYAAAGIARQIHPSRFHLSTRC